MMGGAQPGEVGGDFEDLIAPSRFPWHPALENNLAMDIRIGCGQGHSKADKGGHVPLTSPLKEKMHFRPVQHAPESWPSL